MKNDSTIPAYVHVTNEHADKEHTYEIIETSKNFLVFRETFKGNKSFIQAELLKPCTNYTVKVIGCSPIEGSPISFISSGEVTATSYNVTSINDTDVCFEVEFSGFKGKVIQCIERTPENSCISKEKTIQLDTCSCTMSVTMPPVTPYITFNQAVPSQFKWTNKNAKCDNKSMAIVCNSKITYNVDEDVSLLPLTQYTCTGKYTYHRHHTIESNTLLINITCMFAAPVFEKKTHNSTVMSWNSFLGANCSGIKFNKYSASCHNKTNKPVTGNCKQFENSTKCRFEGLIPYTDYNCDITATDQSLNYIHNIKGDFNTTSYYPNFTSKIDVHYSSHNSFTAKCNEPYNWYGEKRGYVANISIDGKIENTSEEKQNCHFEFTDLYYHTKYTITIRAINTDGKETAITETTDTKYNDKAVIGFLAFLIIVTSVALLFVLYKIYLLRRKQSRNSEEDGILLASPLISVEPISADGLVEAYKSKIADEGRLFLAEFQSIPRIFSNYTIKEAKKAENQSKNRYVDILPYDYNRVTLSSGAEHDYINASFIEGYKEPKKYIAAQGPKDETIDDFWRMIWEQQSSIIVMVTRCEEGNKSKCAQYWPSLDRETEIFDDFIVKIKTEENCPEYIIRHLVLTNKREKGAEREVTHIQFISWPDHGVPGDPSLLLKLRRRVNSFKNFFSGPVVVHCSAGVGRTGTYIGIDAMIESLEAEGQVDIYGYVAKLRRQRCLMVQVEAQYILIHTALIEHNQFGETEMSLPEFHSVLNTLRQKDGTDPSLLEMEFQKLPKFKNWRTFNTAANEENKKKNRCSSVVPYDYNRVIFRLDVECNQITDPDDEDYSSDEEEEESNEYINASFIEGYWCSKSLIAAQGPLQNTMAEFLLMLYQQQTKTVVMLSDCTENDKEHCSQYWGDEKKVFGEMEIEVKKTESFPTYVRRQLEIQSTKKKEVLEVNQYQFLKWRNCDLPENPHELIEMMRHIKENGGYDNSKMNRNIPIVVHCIDGSSRTGIFCALWNLMDSASTEKLVDVFQVVKNLRRERRGICETVEQYQFLYSALEGAFPVQNGGVKTPASNDSVQIVNEKTALLSDPESTTGADQKEAETSQAQEAPAASEEAAAASENPTASSPPEEGASETSGVSEKPSTEGTTNGPSVSVEA